MSPINIFKRCRKYKVESVWHCPEFLFIIFGLIIIAAIITTSALANSYGGPEAVIIISPIITAVLIIIAYSIIKSFEHLASASEMKSEFISIMSHQLRSPLTSIKWQIEAYLLKAGRENIPQNNVIRTVLKENENMLGIINKFLELKKIEEGDFILNKKDFSVSDLIKDIAENKNKQFPSPAISFKQNYDGLVLADYDKIKFVLENIIDNGLKYSPDSKEIEILMEKNGNNIKISVSDKGAGISSEAAKKIFQKFVRPEEDLKYRVPGLGLGLYLSKKIIEKHFEKIKFQTQKGKGSTFWFTMPLKT